MFVLEQCLYREYDHLTNPSFHFRKRLLPQFDFPMSTLAVYFLLMSLGRLKFTFTSHA